MTSADSHNLYDNESLKPTPDPTVLTTEQLLREISRLEKLTEQQTEGVKKVVDERLNGLRDLTIERFKSAAELAALTERQRIERKEDDRISLNAALAAAEKAVTATNDAVDKANLKTERATADQLAQLSTTFTTALSGLTTLQQSIQTRVEKIENVKQGGAEVGVNQRAALGMVFAGMSAFVAFISVVAAIYFAVHK